MRETVLLLKDHSKSTTDEESFAIELRLAEVNGIVNDIVDKELNSGKHGINRLRTMNYHRSFI